MDGKIQGNQIVVSIADTMIDFIYYLSLYPATLYMFYVQKIYLRLKCIEVY